MIRLFERLENSAVRLSLEFLTLFSIRSHGKGGGGGGGIIGIINFRFLVITQDASKQLIYVHIRLNSLPWKPYC